MVFDTASKGKTIIVNGHFLYTSKSVNFKETTLVKLPGNAVGKKLVEGIFVYTTLKIIGT